MKLSVIIISTTMGVEFEINNQAMMAAIIKKADEILCAPKIKKDRGKVYLEPGDRYFLYLPNRNKLIFHKRQEARIKGWIVNEGIHRNIDVSFTEQKVEVYEPYKTEFDNYGFDMVVPPDMERFVYQNDLVEFGLDNERLQTIVEVQPGRGKAISIYEPLLTPDGWKLMGDIKVGDKVIGSDGYPTTVTGVFPQPSGLKTYLLTTIDGRKLRVCGEHLWTTSHTYTTSKFNWDIRNTLEIKRLLEESDKPLYIPLPLATSFNPIKEPLQVLPYDKGVELSGQDTTIPRRYMEASGHERWEFMRGLMDIDGEVIEDGKYASYSTLSKQFALDVQELAWSLGGIAHLKEEGSVYSVVMGFVKPQRLFDLSDNKHLIKDEMANDFVPRVRVKSVELVESEPMQCISVSAVNSLYVANNYIVTHNTKSSQKILVKKGVRACIIVKPSYMDKWEFDCVKDKTGLRVKDRHVRKVNGVDAVVQLVKDGMSGKLDREKIKIIIISTTTLQLFIKDYCAHPTWYDFELRDFYRLLGVGEVLYDEIHEHFLTVYLTGICLSPPSTIEMSATLEPSAMKEFIRARYLERFPKDSRFTVDYIPCVDGRGVYYHIEDNHLLSRANRMSMYNHNNFEKLLIQNRMLNSYFDMIYDIYKKTMYPNYEKGQKALFLFSLIETCTRFRDYIEFKTKQDGYNFNVVKYNGGDSFSEFIAADIAVSTPGKAGTAVDVPGLANMYITIPIDDKQLNEQMAGRPRPLIQWNMNPRAWFFHCMEVKKHCGYLNNRLRSLEEKMLSFKIIDTPHVIRRSNDNASRFTTGSGTVPRNVSKKLPRVHISGISGGRKRPPRPGRRKR